MEIKNKLLADSLAFTDGTKNIFGRKNELEKLDEIIRFCRGINEKVWYDSNLMELPVAPQKTFSDALFTQNAVDSADVQRLLLEIYERLSFCDDILSDDDDDIWCSCGKYEGAADTLSAYSKYRQNFLATIKKSEEYAEFMDSCFPNSIFSSGCKNEVRYIQHFEKNVREITKCLSILDEFAIPLYAKYHDNLSLAKKELQAMMPKTTVALQDPKHRKEVVFEFEDACGNGEKTATKLVECQPHVKLVRNDSDLRIYFYWRDLNIADGKKVLIGQIGRHAW